MGVVIDVADAMSFRGGAGGGCNVSGRCVSLRDDGDETIEGLEGCSCVETDRERRQTGGIR